MFATMKLLMFLVVNNNNYDDEFQLIVSNLCCSEENTVAVECLLSDTLPLHVLRQLLKESRTSQEQLFGVLVPQSFFVCSSFFSTDSSLTSRNPFFSLSLSLLPLPVDSRGCWRHRVIMFSCLAVDLWKSNSAPTHSHVTFHGWLLQLIAR